MATYSPRALVTPLLGAMLAASLVAAASQCGGGQPTGPSAPTVDVGPVPLAVPVTAVAAAPVTFVGAGDIGMCDGNADRTARLLDGIPGTVFTLGDHAYYQGTRQQFRDCYDGSWGRHRARTRPVPGNHDYETPDAQPYFEYFGAAAGPAGLGYYSFDIGSWHAIALNSNIPIGPGSAQIEWLRRDLAAHPGLCTIAYWHHPLFSSGSEGGSSRVRDVWRILYAAGADIVLAGHEHFYERFAPQDPNGSLDAARGIRQFIVGSGGATLYPAGSGAANSERRISAFGVLKLTLKPDAYDWDFVSLTGGGDSGSGACR